MPGRCLAASLEWGGWSRSWGDGCEVTEGLKTPSTQWGFALQDVVGCCRRLQPLCPSEHDVWGHAQVLPAPPRDSEGAGCGGCWHQVQHMVLFP